MILLSYLHSSTAVALVEALVVEALAAAVVVEDSLAVDALRSTFEVLSASGRLVRLNPALYVMRISYLLCYFFAFHRCFSTIYLHFFLSPFFPLQYPLGTRRKNAHIFLSRDCACRHSHSIFFKLDLISHVRWQPFHASAYTDKMLRVILEKTQINAVSTTSSVLVS